MPLRSLWIGYPVHRSSSAGCKCRKRLVAEEEVPVMSLVYCYILLEHAATCPLLTFPPITHSGNWFNYRVCLWTLYIDHGCGSRGCFDAKKSWLELTHPTPTFWDRNSRPCTITFVEHCYASTTWFPMQDVGYKAEKRTSLQPRADTFKALPQCNNGLRSSSWGSCIWISQPHNQWGVLHHYLWLYNIH